MGLALLTAGGAHAQRSATGSELQELNKTSREQLHPGEPLKIRGIAQDANDFLANTPALRGQPSADALVAAEEAHARRLAMYETGQRFDSPPASAQRFSGGNSQVPLDRIKPNPAGTDQPIEEDSAPSSSRFVLPGVILGLLIHAARKFTR
jgi:hypothetical protein